MPAITYHPRNPPIYITDSEFWKKRNIPMFLSLSLSLSLSLNFATLLMILQNTYQGRKEGTKQAILSSTIMTFRNPKRCEGQLATHQSKCFHLHMTFRNAERCEGHLATHQSNAFTYNNVILKS
jgi:hypothetical protein